MNDLEFRLPSPEHPVEFSGIPQGFFMKRDDLIHPIINGNKWRKLKPVIEKAKADGCTGLLSVGGVWSNHLPALACAAALNGLGSAAILRGEDVDSFQLRLLRWLGCELHFVDRQTFRDKTLLEETYKKPGYLFVPEGGKGPESAAACGEIVQELTQEYDRIFLACGTGTTLSGVLTAARERYPNCKVHAVLALRNRVEIEQNLRDLQWEVAFTNLVIEDHFNLGGFAKTTAEYRMFLSKWMQETGILLDPVYNGKVLWALYHRFIDGSIGKNERVLIINSGGWLGLGGISLL